MPRPLRMIFIDKRHRQLGIDASGKDRPNGRQRQRGDPTDQGPIPGMGLEVLDLSGTGAAHACQEHVSAPLNKHGHAGTQSLGLLDWPRTHFKGLDVITARLPRRSPGRVFTLGADIVNSELDGSATQRGHLTGDLPADLDGREFVLAQIEYSPYVVKIDQRQNRKARWSEF